MKLDIEYQDDKLGPPVVVDESDRLSSASESDLRARRRQKVELDYRAREQVSLNSVTDLALKYQASQPASQPARQLCRLSS